jgi:cytochrome d ubiquinol oxidase subunit II
VAMGNVILGVPHGLDPDTLRPVYTGMFYQLFTPFALLSGVLSVAMLAMHGAVLLAWRTEDPIAGRARAWARLAALLTIVLFVLGGFWVAYGVDGQVASGFDPGAPSNPLLKTVTVQVGAWMNNFQTWPLMWIAPVLGVAGALLVLLAPGAGAVAFIASAASIVGVILTVGFALFPFLLPSSSQPAAGLTIWDASSSHMTLWIMLVAVAIFLPIITIYTSWVYRVMRGKVTSESVGGTPNSY